MVKWLVLFGWAKLRFSKKVVTVIRWLLGPLQADAESPLFSARTAAWMTSSSGSTAAFVGICASRVHVWRVPAPEVHLMHLRKRRRSEGGGRL